MGRPLQEAVEAQQRHIAALANHIAEQNLVIDYIGKMAGITPQVTAIRTQARRVVADALNPAQPVPDPPSQPATTTTQEAATPEAYDNPLVPGQTPGSVQHLPADATGTVMDPGTTLPTAPYTNLVDVQAPVAGTETHVPLDQTRTEVDVRVGDPMNPTQAFPWTLGNTASAQNRSMASLRLARLRLQAGTAKGDDLTVQAAIESDSSLTAEAINAEIGTLTSVMQAAASRTASQRPAGAVPRQAQGVQRTTPSLVGSPSLTTQASASSVADDTADSDLFD